MGDRFPKPQGFLEDDQLLRRGNVCALVGPGSSYKTWFLMFMEGQIALGRPVNKFLTRQGRCIFLSEELEIASMIERMKALWIPSEAQELGDLFRVRCGSNFDFYSRTLESQKRLERIWKEEGEPDFIGIDGLSNIHHGNENSNQDMGIVFGAIKDVSREINSNVSVVHHYGKPNEFRKGIDKARGAAVIKDICSDVILVDPEKGRSVLTIAKHRDYRHGEPRPFSFAVEPRMEDSRSVTLTFADVEIEDTVSNPRYVTEIVSKVEELAGDGEVLREALYDSLGWGRRRFDEALSAAVRDGKLGRERRGRESSYYIPRGSIRVDEGVDVNEG